MNDHGPPHTVPDLLNRIERNQRIQARFHDYEFRLLACRRLPQLLEQLLTGARAHFELTAVSLALHDPDYRISTVLEHLQLPLIDGLSIHHSAEFFHELFGGEPRITLGPLSDGSRQILFAGLSATRARMESAALLPLFRQETLIGSLHFGSESPTRYSADMGVTFMNHLAAMVAICLENCIALEQLQRRGEEDILTQLPNRRRFDEELAKELERAHRQGEALSCLFADIDYFKQINDVYGHQVGDRCLRQVAQQISRELRKTDLLARYGGEEFVALLPACSAELAALTAERVRLAVANQPLILSAEESIPLTISIGLSTWLPESGREDLALVGENLLRRADAAMYRAKEAGRNRVCRACT